MHLFIHVSVFNIQIEQLHCYLKTTFYQDEVGYKLTCVPSPVIFLNASKHVLGDRVFKDLMTLGSLQVGC